MQLKWTPRFYIMWPSGETTSVGQFVEALKLDKTDPDKPTAVLLDLSHILPVSADVWLFELSVVGAVRDPIGGNSFLSMGVS